MSDGETYIVKRRDLADIMQTQDPGALAEFLEQPLPAIAELITGMMAAGPKVLAVSGLRIAQGALKARMFQQVAREIRELRESGKIREDFAEQKLGYESWVELLIAIDEDLPDEERLEALKAMFFGVNRINAQDAERILSYQLFQISKRLNSGELLTLQTVFRMKDFAVPPYFDDLKWEREVAKYMELGVASLVMYHSTRLTECHLLNAPKQSNINRIGDRLTDLGERFCRNIENYRIARKA